jgi:hypothetical protein
MNAYKQLNKHDPDNGVVGDCFRTVFGCLLNIEPCHVPHFVEQCNEYKDSCELADEWLATKGYKQVHSILDGDKLPIQLVLDHVYSLNPGVYYILGGTSKNDTDHVVICLNNKIIHDPAIDDSGIVGPCADGLYWVTYLTSIDMVAK